MVHGIFGPYAPFLKKNVFPWKQAAAAACQCIVILVTTGRNKVEECVFTEPEQLYSLACILQPPNEEGKKTKKLI